MIKRSKVRVYLNDSENVTFGDGEFDSAAEYDETGVGLTDYKDEQIAKVRLKENQQNSWADGLPAELFKFGGDELVMVR